jgi:RNA polymerase sigma-70 factor (ECF subfamily)
MTEVTVAAPNFLLPNTAETEERLVSRAQEGDEAAFNELAERYSTRLRRTLYRITRDCDAAYDAVQEALIRAWKNIGRFEGRSRFYTWLTRIGINEAYRGVGRPKEESLEMIDLVGERVPDWGDQPDRVFESREFLGAIDDALAELPLDYRTAVTLRDVEGLSTTEAAEVLGIGERALKSRLHRGRMALRAKLDDYFEEGYG